MYGMHKREFMHCTPNDLYLFFEQKQKRMNDEQKMQADIMDHQAWLTGVYIQRAVASVMNKKSKYPSEPFSQKKSRRMVATEDMTDSEKRVMIDQLFANLEEMQRTFEISQKRTGNG